GSAMAEDLGDQFQALKLSLKESKDVELDTTDVKLSDEECRRSVLGKIIGDRKASIFGIKRMMSVVWQTSMAFEVKEVEANIFQFIFGCKEDKEKVLAGVNWVFENQYLVLQDWREGLSFQDPSFNEISLWVQVHKLPLNWLSIEVGQKIGRLFKRIKNVVVVKSGGAQGSYLRMLVSHDISEPILRCAHIKLGDQRLGVTFLYEKLVSCCYYCGIVGHLERSCDVRAKDIEEGKQMVGQFGEWLKAMEIGRMGGSSQNSSPSQTNSNLHSQGNHSNPGQMNSTNAEQEMGRSNGGIPQSDHPNDILSTALVVSSEINTGNLQPVIQREDHNLSLWVQSEVEEVKRMEIHQEIVKDMMIPVRDQETIVPKPTGLDLVMKPNSSTWKRKKSESGRLQRTMETPIEAATHTIGKRNRPLLAQA
ncbi:Unknown protein, partial [Striga hermonthica]